MSVWDLDFQRGWRLGLLFGVLLLGAAGGLFAGALMVPPGILTFVLGLLSLLALGGLGVVAYWLAHSVRAEYGLDRNGLEIRWGGYVERIPLPAIVAVETEVPLRWVRGVRWPGLCFGWARDAQGRPVRCYATDLAEALVVRTAERAYALTPAQRAEFLEGLQQRLEMGPTQDFAPGYTHPAFLDWAFWRDRLALGLVLAGALFSLGLSGLLFVVYPLLPATLTVREATAHSTALVQAAWQLFRLPAGGALVWALHLLVGGWLYRRERTASLLLWAVALAFVLTLWGAVIALVLKAV